MKKELKDRQTLIDLAIQESGSLEGLFEVADRNEISLTTDTIAGTPMEIPDVINKSTRNLYEQKKIIPVTGLSKEERSTLLFEGINYMGIEIDFIVS